MLECPVCSAKADKIIAAGLPMYFCSNPDCCIMWGFWSYFYTYLVAPIEGFLMVIFLLWCMRDLTGKH